MVRLMPDQPFLVRATLQFGNHEASAAPSHLEPDSNQVKFEMVLVTE
jgi:hypothetical protein